MNKYQYKLIIAELLKKSNITQNLDKIKFRKNTGGQNLFDMIWLNTHLNEEIRFGILEIDKKFLEFLRSGEAPQGSHSADEAYLYLKTDDLDFDRGRATQEQYDIVKNNLLTAQGDDFYAINKMLNTGTDKTFVKMNLDTNKKNALVSSFEAWLKTGRGLKSEPIPHLAKIKNKKISFREK